MPDLAPGCLYHHAYPVGYQARKIHFGRTWQGLPLDNFSAPPQSFLVTEATAGVHFSAQPETILSMRPPSIALANKMCSCQAEKWTRVAHKRCLR